jgi:hypothetical protein
MTLRMYVDGAMTILLVLFAYLSSGAREGGVEEGIQSSEQTIEFVLSSPMEEKTGKFVVGGRRERNQAERSYEAQRKKRKRR